MVTSKRRTLNTYILPQTEGLGICSCLEMVEKDLAYNLRVAFIGASLNSLDFLIGLGIGQSNGCHQRDSGEGKI